MMRYFNTDYDISGILDEGCFVNEYEGSYTVSLA